MYQNASAPTVSPAASIDNRTIEEIVTEIQEGINTQQNKELLCNRLENLVRWCIKKYLSTGLYRSKDVLDDYMQEGYTGILEAAGKYTPGKSKFSNYAKWYIRKNLYKHRRFRKTSIYIPFKVWEEIVTIEKATRELEINGMDINTVNLSELTGLTPRKCEDISKTCEMINTISLYSKSQPDEDGGEFWEILEADNDVEGSVIQEIFSEALQEAIKDAEKKLSKRQSGMIHEKYYENASLDDIGKKYECRPHTASVTIQNGIGRLRSDTVIFEFASEVLSFDAAMQKHKEAFEQRRKEEERRRERYKNGYGEYQKQWYEGQKRALKENT